MVDITAKRGPIDPNDYTNNQGVATQTYLRRLDDDIEYEQNEPSTWDTIIGGVKDVLDIGKGVGQIANSFKDLEVKDESIKVSEEQIEASKVNRQKAELDMERTKQDMRIKSIKFDMALKEKQDVNNALENVITYMQSDDDIGLNNYLGTNPKAAVLLAKEFPGIYDDMIESFDNRTTEDKTYRTDMLKLFRNMNIKPGDRLKDQLTLLKIQETQAKIANLTNNNDNDVFGLFGSGSNGGGSSKNTNKKANPAMANEYVNFVSDMSEAFNSVNQYKNDATGINGNILGAMDKLGYPMAKFEDMGYFVQTANIEVLDANNAYTIKKIQDILENKEDSKFLPKDIDIEAFTPDSKSGVIGKSIVKFSNSKGTAFVAVDKPTADIWRGLKSKQTTLRDLQREYKKRTGKNVADYPLLGDSNVPIVDTNLQAERFVKSMGQPQISEWYNNAPYEKQRTYVQQQIQNITKSGDTKDVVDYVIYGHDLENNPEWDAESLQEFRDTMEAKYREFRKAAPGKNIAEQRMAVNNDLLQFIVPELSKGTSLKDIRDQILNAETSRELAWEVKANEQLAAIETLTEQDPNTEVELIDLPTPSYFGSARNALGRGTRSTINLPSKILPIPEVKGDTIPIKEVPSYVTKKYIDEDTRDLLIEQEYSKLSRENDRSTGPTTAPVSSKLREEAKNKVDRAIYEFIVKARAKKMSDKLISAHLNYFVEDISMLPTILNNMVPMGDMIEQGLKSKFTWRGNQIRNKETSKRLKKALKD